MNNITQQIIETEKGCGKKFKPFQSNLSVINHDEGICGTYKDNTFFFCDECDIKLSTLKSCEKFIEEARIEERNRIIGIIDKFDFFCCNYYGHTDDKLEGCDKEELKQQIGGQK